MTRCYFPGCKTYALDGYGFCRKHVKEITGQDELPTAIEFRTKYNLALQEAFGGRTNREATKETDGISDKASFRKFRRKSKSKFTTTN